MNTAQHEFTRQQLQLAANYLTLQYGSVIFLSLAYVFFVTALLAVMCNRRRLALFLACPAWMCTFLVPTPITKYGSPTMLVASCIAIILITLRGRAIKRTQQEITEPAQATADAS